MIFKKKFNYNLKLTITTLIWVITSCNSNKNNYSPSISYNELETSNEVRLELPNGESKIIYKIDEPIFESGKKCSYTQKQPLSGLNFLNNDKTFLLVNTSYAKLSGGKYDVFYIYIKNDTVIVFREQIWVSGVSDSGVIFNGNIQQAKGDNLLRKDAESRENNNKVITEFVDDYDPYSKIVLTEKGKDITLNQYDDEALIVTLEGRLFNNKIYINSELSDGIDYYFNGNKLCYYTEGNPDEVCFSKIKEINNGNEINYFNGERLNDSEKIVKLNWEMENKINLESDWDNDPRFSSNTLKVPNGKVWVLIYIDEHYYFESGLQLDLIPMLFVNNTKLNWVYRRSFSDKKNINISKSKVENLIFQSNQTIQAISDRQKSNTVGEDFSQYSGEMWFLETTMNPDLQQKRNTFDLNRLKEQNEALQTDINATKRSIRAKKWKEDAEKKILRGY